MEYTRRAHREDRQGIILTELVKHENPVLVMPVRLDSHMLVVKVYEVIEA